MFPSRIALLPNAPTFVMETPATPRNVTDREQLNLVFPIVCAVNTEVIHFDIIGSGLASNSSLSSMFLFRRMTVIFLFHAAHLHVNNACLRLQNKNLLNSHVLHAASVCGFS